MKYIRSTMTIAVLGLLSASFADLTAVNGVKVYPRVFNDIPTSNFSSSVNYPGSVVMQDDNVNTGGWANRHIWYLSDSNGTNPFAHPGGDMSFEYTFDAKLETTAGGVEAGMFLRFPVDGGWISEVQYLIKGDGFVVAFGTPIPFYNMADAGWSYTPGSTVKMGIRYYKNAFDNYVVQWIYGNNTSPEMLLDGAVQGLPWDFRTLGLRPTYDSGGPKENWLGAYLQVPKPAAASKFTVSNITLDPYPWVKATIDLDSAANVGQMVNLEVRDMSSNAVLQTATSHWRPNGTVAFKPTVPAGGYKLAVKSDTHLQEVVNINITGTGDYIGALTLTNGDVDNSNAIDLADYLILVSAFDTASGDSGYLAGADLNKDGSVDLGDYLILVGNFDLVGMP